MKNAEKAEFVRYILQTPDGYLTKFGTTADIYDENIIVLPASIFGATFSSKESKVRIFFEYSHVTRYPTDECQIFGYVCHVGPHSCAICYKSNCKFWKNRTNSILFKVD